MENVTELFTKNASWIATIAICCLMLAIGLLRHARHGVTTVRPNLALWSVLLMGAAGIVLLPAAWYAWLNSESGTARHINQLVAQGNISRASELAAARGMWNVLAESMEKHECKDFRPVLDKGANEDNILLWFEKQLAADPGIAIDYAVAQTEFATRRLLFERILQSHGRPIVKNEYLVDQRPELLIAFLEIKDQTILTDIEGRLYSCALRAGARPERLELARALVVFQTACGRPTCLRR